jgi:hypothetical protein
MNKETKTNRIDSFLSALNGVNSGIASAMVLLLDWFSNQNWLQEDFSLEPFEEGSQPLTQNAVCGIIASHFGRSVSGLRLWLEIGLFFESIHIKRDTFVDYNISRYNQIRKYLGKMDTAQKLTLKDNLLLEPKQWKAFLEGLKEQFKAEQAIETEVETEVETEETEETEDKPKVEVKAFDLDSFWSVFLGLSKCDKGVIIGNLLAYQGTPEGQELTNIAQSVLDSRKEHKTVNKEDTLAKEIDKQVVLYSVRCEYAKQCEPFADAVTERIKAIETETGLSLRDFPMIYKINWKAQTPKTIVQCNRKELKALQS